jgi:NAD(P)H-flavin reductase/hemoglobin-like flavoprotein
MPLNARVVKESFAQLEPVSDKAVAYFYGRLFAESPRLRAMFPPAMDAQRDRLFHALTRIVWSLDSPDTLACHLSRLGNDHRKFGVLEEHYAAVGAALIATVRKFSRDTWTPEIEEDWTAAYSAAASLMINAAGESALTTPPWWVGQVVEHERRTADIAVLAIRPNHRLEFTAGQYLTVQTSRWPRVWRPYSLAGAPREDGVLHLHVRAQPAGWVSGTLVRHTKAGDTMLLGPALGTMALDPESGRDLLMVAGGTGLAPVKAIVEQVIRSGQRRSIHLVFGARTERDLYDLADLRLLESAYPGLRVIPVVSADPGFAGLRGQACDVLEDLHDWDEHDVYVAGPAEMIAVTVQRLHHLGVLPTRIHYDSLSL